MKIPIFSKTVLSASLAAVLLTGCAVAPEMTAEEKSALGTSWNAAVPEAKGPSLEVAESWWKAWNDPVLFDLIEKALASNTDVRTALANLRAAAALSDQATAELFPTASLSGEASRNRRNGETTKSYSAGGSASWSFSLAGGNVAAQRAANREALASAMTVEDTKIAVASEVAQNYINLRLAEGKLAIAKETLKNYEEAADIATWRLAAGLATQSEVDQANSTRDSSRAKIPSAETSIAKYRNALARLCVVNASEIAAATNATIPVAPSNIAVSVPAETLRQRPDMRSAEYAVMAASDRVYEAQTGWFPTLKISGNIGTQAATISALGTSGTGIAALVGALSMPLFNWKEQISTTEQKKAALDKARATYTSTLVKALEETENALEGISSSERRVADLESSLAAAKSAADLALLEYRSGISDYQTVLSTERTLLSARESVAENSADRSTNYVKLYTALGGGWKAPQTEETEVHHE